MGERSHVDDDRETERPDRTRAPGSIGAVLALLVLAAFLAGAGTSRPPLTGSGVWTTPFHVVLGILAAITLVGVVVVARALPRGSQRPTGGGGRRWWTLLLTALVIGGLVWLRGRGVGPEAPPPGSGFDLGPLVGGARDAVAPVATSPTAVAGGWLFLVLLVVLVALTVQWRWRRGVPGTTDHPAEAAAVTQPASVPSDGHPDEVVLAAWAAARDAVAAWLGTGALDTPGRLLRRVRGTAVAAPLRTLTVHYLPVRYGRSAATAADAAAARRALAAIRETTSSAPRPQARR